MSYIQFCGAFQHILEEFGETKSWIDTIFKVKKSNEKVLTKLDDKLGPLYFNT